MKRIADIHRAVIDGSSEIGIYRIVDDDTGEVYFIFEETIDFHPPLICPTNVNAHIA